jgi:hypothetical protein
VRVAGIAALKPGLGNPADDLSVVCAVALNDRSHSGQRAGSRDEILC